MNRHNGKVHKRRVVITGLGAVTPIGLDVPSFWSAARQGRSGVERISAFDPERLPCRIAAEVKGFAPERHLEPRRLRRAGRSVPMAIAAAAEALASAGIEAASMTLEEKRSWAVIVGSGGGGPDFVEAQYRCYFGDELRKASAYNIPGSTIGTLSSEISLSFDFKGPSHVLSTGCTSSTDALGYAFNSIRFGLLERAISGGVDACITPAIMQGFSIMRAVPLSFNDSPHQASRPFDRRREGFVLGEGAWMMVLEERERALERGAPILAEILGYASTCDAYHMVRLDPTGEEPARAMELALRDAEVAKDEVGYVALHGTSTPLNDPVETQALKRCFGRRAYDLPMSALKSMIGHPQGASGAAGVMAAILAMRDGFLPPTINYSEPDPECDLDYIPNRGRARRVEVVLCNCLGFGSKNSVLIVARADSRG
jgi:3-oxoacyl-[acyl-carrier-protein] synthase II